jgi:hypothetical protein
MLRNLKSLFIVEDKANKPVQDGPVEKGSEVSETTPSSSTRFRGSVKSSGAGKVDDKFLEVLFGALDEKNKEGFDYMEFKEFLRSLANVPMEDKTRYQSAFATAQTMGATKENIVSSAKEYIKILAQEQVKFQQALDGQKEKNLTTKHQEIQREEQEIRKKEEEMERLKKEIEGHRNHITTLEVEINEASQRLGETADNFEATYQALLEQIQQDITNIESHL